MTKIDKFLIFLIIVGVCILVFSPNKKHFSDAGIQVLKTDVEENAKISTNKRKAYEDAKKSYLDKYGKFLLPGELSR